MKAKPVYWVGVKSRPPQTVFQQADENKVNEKNYPQFAYCLGPYESKAKAEADAKTHVNKDGTFTDPFCNNGGGR
jgi:hypothetical protein